MAKMTIAQLREVQLEKFTEKYFAGDTDTAKNIINRYYRLCGMDDRLLILDNDSYHHNKPYTQELHNKADKALDRLQADLKKYGLKIIYFSWLPTICEADSTSKAYYAYFYN